MADFPFDSASFAAAFGSSFGVVFTGLAAGSPLFSTLGGSGGGGGGIDIPFGAAGGSETCAAYLREHVLTMVSCRKSRILLCFISKMMHDHI